jgi:hypothetical protein
MTRAPRMVYVSRSSPLLAAGPAARLRPARRHAPRRRRRRRRGDRRSGRGWRSGAFARRGRLPRRSGRRRDACVPLTCTPAGGRVLREDRRRLRDSARLRRLHRGPHLRRRRGRPRVSGSRSIRAVSPSAAPRLAGASAGASATAAGAPSTAGCVPNGQTCGGVTPNVCGGADLRGPLQAAGELSGGRAHHRLRHRASAPRLLVRDGRSALQRAGLRAQRPRRSVPHGGLL